MPAVRDVEAAIIVFDLGGTWWRSAILMPDDTFSDLAQRAALTRACTGSNAATLRELMVAYLLDRTRQLMQRQPDVRVVGICIGAAINGHTGHILASAPLWGDCTDPYDLRAALALAEPELRWWVVNDVTSLALAITASDQVRDRDLRVITAVTVSSGIAARTVDVRSGEVLLDRRHGLQGEIGHLPALTPSSWGTDVPRCDCGAVGHVSAISSGNAIDRLLSQMVSIVGLGDEIADGASRLPRLRAALDANNPDAVRFLDWATAPLARALLYLLAIDPRVDRVFLAGGVVDTLGEHYMHSLYRMLEADGLYLVSIYQPSVFRDRISRLESDGFEPLRGAGLFARQQSQLLGEGNR